MFTDSNNMFRRTPLIGTFQQGIYPTGISGDANAPQAGRASSKVMTQLTARDSLLGNGGTGGLVAGNVCSLGKN